MSTTTAGAFGAKVEEYMERLGMQQNELAKKVRLSPSHLSRIVKGTRKPPRVRTVRRMIKALRLTASQAEDFCERAGLSPLILQKNSSNEKKDVRGAARAKITGRREKQNQNTVGHGRVVKSEPQAISALMPTVAHTGKAIPYVPVGAAGEQIERLLASARLSEEDEKKIAAALIEITKHLLALATQREEREED